MFDHMLIQIGLILVISPLVGGIIKKIKAISQKRVGAPILQGYFDPAKLFKKDMVISETTSWIFRATPYIIFISYLIAASMIPISLYVTMPSYWGNIFVVVYLMAMGRFFLALSGMEAGSTFGGMGSSREMMISAFIEPALLVALVTVALVTDRTSIHDIMSSLSAGEQLFNPSLLLSMFSVVIVLMAETSRIPFDDPSTHLELTMVHEAMLLEFSGRGLALMEWAGWIKQLAIMTLIISVFLPGFSISLPAVNFYSLAVLLISIGIFLIKLIILAIFIAIIEVSMVKTRLFSTTNFAAVAFIVAFFAFFQSFVVEVIL